MPDNNEIDTTSNGNWLSNWFAIYSQPIADPVTPDVTLFQQQLSPWYVCLSVLMGGANGKLENLSKSLSPRRSRKKAMSNV